MNEVVISGVVSQVQERGKVLEITLVGKPHQGAFFRVRLKAFGKVKEALSTLKEGRPWASSGASSPGSGREALRVSRWR